jgi:hypothetical protein
MRLKLASRWQHIELGDEVGVEWLPDSFTLNVHWLSGPLAMAKPEVLTLRLDNGNP